MELAFKQKGNVDIVIRGTPQGGDESDIEDMDEDQGGMPEEVTADLETMVSDSEDEDDLPLMNLRKKRKFNNL